MKNETNIRSAYSLAQEMYAELGVDTEKAIVELAQIPVSLHCWQGDDVAGFEQDSTGATGGILSTGNHPGKARTPEELRQDIDKAMSLIPGTLRLNLHAIYRESTRFVERDELDASHFENWIRWADAHGIGLDFNPTFFSHSMVRNGLTLSSPDSEVRAFWVRHGQACRRIASEMGRKLGKRTIMNTWIPDGFKDTPVDRAGARARLKDSLDEMFSEALPPETMRDAVESKLFGIGVESCTVGSHEFYLGYALRNNQLLCLDSGHFHPTEFISDKISSALLFLDEILLHVSRPVRWDSDHVVVFDDELQAIASEIIRNDPGRVNIGLDYFDGSINRIAAWVIGTRNLQMALCKALLEPRALLDEMEQSGDFTGRLATLELLKTLPFQSVYDYFCLTKNVPNAFDAIRSIREYETEVLFKRETDNRHPSQGNSPR